MLRWIRLPALLGLAGLLAAACADPEIPEVVALAPATPTPESAAPTVVVPTAGPTPTPSPAEFEPGLTADTIRIAVIADAGAGEITGELSLSAFQAVEAWARSVNSEGGLVGRTVEVERIDTFLFDHADAIDKACGGDFFALVGSSALFDGEGLEPLLAPDCRLPDFPAVANSTERLEAATTFVSNPITGTTWNAGWARYWTENAPDAVAKAATLLPELGPVVVNGEQMIEAATEKGWTYVYSPVVAFDAEYGSAVQAMIDLEVDAISWDADGDRFLRLVQAIADSELDPAVLDCGQACYSQRWAELAGRAGVGVNVWLPTVPFEELSESPELTRYIFWLRQGNPDVDVVPSASGVASWSAALLFGEAVRRSVKEGTAEFDPDQLTRAGVVAAATDISDWTANGLHGAANPATREPSPCFVIMTLGVGTRWRRVHPRRAGTLDCEETNLVQLSLTSGLEAAAETTPTPGDEPTATALPEPTPEE